MGAAAEDLEARRAAAEQALAAKKEAHDQELALREVVLLETRAKFAAEGTEGEDFVVVDAGPEGPIVLKLGPFVLYKEWRAKVLEDKATIEAAQRFVLACVAFPEAPVIREIVQRRAALVDKLIGPLTRLYEADVSGEQKKR